MAKYDRRCSGCGNVFEVSCKIAEKQNDHPCSDCNNLEGEWLISAPSLVEHQRMSTAKKDSGFKEVLQKISERNPRTNVNQQV